MPTPEEEARQLIDDRLAASGWIVQTYKQMNLAAGAGLAVTEFPGAHGPSDYLLYVEGKAIGVVEASDRGPECPCCPEGLVPPIGWARVRIPGQLRRQISTPPSIKF